MSIKALVKLELTNEKISLSERINLSFKIAELGIKNKIGTNFGGNISRAFSDLLENSKSYEMFFELIDDSMDINADVLFIGNGVQYFMKDTRIDIGESLSSRMKRVQFFVKELLNNKLIKNIILDIDALEQYDLDRSEPLILKIDDFLNKIIDMYEQSNQFTPMVRIYFMKKSMEDFKIESVQKNESNTSYHSCFDKLTKTKCNEGHRHIFKYSEKGQRIKEIVESLD